MHPIFIYILPYILIGIVGMALGGRKANVTAEERKQRWTKLVVYVLILLGVIISILAQDRYFFYLSLAIVVIGQIELIKVALKHPATIGFYIKSEVMWIVVSLGFVYFAATTPANWVLMGYFIVITFDGFSQIFGQIFGKRPFFQQISPNKTLEGTLGGALSGLTAAVVASNWVNISWVTAIGLGLATVVFAQIGDLTASYYKRIHQVKDFSKLLPGQGGVIDRFDSFLVVGALYGYVGGCF